jgi:transposase
LLDESEVSEVLENKTEFWLMKRATQRHDEFGVKYKSANQMPK